MSTSTITDPDADDPRESLTSYREGDELVICDRSNPRAWIRSSVTVPVGSGSTTAPTPDAEA